MIHDVANALSLLIEATDGLENNHNLDSSVRYAVDVIEKYRQWCVSGSPSGINNSFSVRLLLEWPDRWHEIARCQNLQSLAAVLGILLGSNSSDTRKILIEVIDA